MTKSKGIRPRLRRQKTRVTVGEAVAALQALVAACPEVADAPYFIIHGEARKGKVSTEYRIWQGILKRCFSPSDPRFRDYGGRGIYVVPRWYAFQRFLEDMGRRPVGYSLDRRDNNGPYSKENCRWATKTEQMRNTRANRHLTVNGETRLLCEWVERVGLPSAVISKRLIRGWTHEQAVLTPLLPTGTRAPWQKA